MRSARAIGVEAVVACLAAFALIVSAMTIHVSPTDRVGQVSGLAAIGVRFTLMAIVLVGGLVVVARWRAVHFERAEALACAAAAGLASGFLASGVVVALHGTPFALGGILGDSGVLIDWADQVRAGGRVPSAMYPPLQIHALAWLADALGTHSAYAMKWFQIIGVALLGPTTYVGWRLHFRAPWALAIGVVSALPCFEAYRPYPMLSLLVMIPVVLAFLRVLRRADEHSAGRLVAVGAAIGIVLGVNCLLYSGWYQWSAPGVVITAAWVFPWRRAPRAGALLCAVAGIAFAALTWRYFVGAFGDYNKDNYFPFDARVDPAYIASWRGDLPGALEGSGLWPPFGELGGATMLTLVVIAGLGCAITWGRNRTIVVAVALILAGTWLMRMHRAAAMFETGDVGLYTRTSAELVNGLLLLTGIAGWLYARRREWPATPSTAIGALSALLVLFATTGSAISDRYMARPEERDQGHLAYLAQRMPRYERTQTRYGYIHASTSHETAELSATNLIDGKAGTLFEMLPIRAHTGDPWIEIDLPEERGVTRAVVWPAGPACSPTLVLEYRSGDDIWMPLAWGSAPNANAGPMPIGGITRVYAQQFRVRALESQPGCVWRLAELELYR